LDDDGLSVAVAFWKEFGIVRTNIESKVAVSSPEVASAIRASIKKVGSDNESSDLKHGRFQHDDLFERNAKGDVAISDFRIILLCWLHLLLI
jgi:hypothetical protein